MSLAAYLKHHFDEARTKARELMYLAKTGYRHSGERVSPDFPDENFENHLKVYHFAKQFASGKDVLDVGCGTGYGTALLGEVARSIVGVDISGPALAWARKRYPNMIYRQMDVHKLEFPDNSFDFIVSTENFEHLRDQKGHALELARVLRPDGLCFLGTPNPEMFLNDNNPFHVKENTFEELVELFSAAFADVTILENTLEPSTPEGMRLRNERWARNAKGRPVPQEIDTTWLNNTHSYNCLLKKPLKPRAVDSST
jgi:ubiquinone/menaquinone biosynthesis C-methylase UbiE